MSLADFLLRPLALPYEVIVRLRGWAYGSGIFQQKRIEGTVISVGNLTVGGTGKTPMVLWIAERLLAEGKSVGILTRGYRGKSAGGVKPATAAQPANSSSDEAQLLRARLSERVAIGVGADRFAKGTELAKQGIQWFILDDGFQHRQLARDVDIVLIDAVNPFGGGHLLPAGRLREPRSALARANIIVITRSDHSPAIEGAVRHDSAAPIYYANPELDAIRPVGESAAAEVAVDEWRGKKLFAFCGIGNPLAFVTNLREWGFQIVGHMFFRDHHRYAREDALAIEAESRRLGADGLICTEKDSFNLSRVRWDNIKVLYCRISLRIDREEEFWRAVIAAAGPDRRAGHC